MGAFQIKFSKKRHEIGVKKYLSIHSIKGEKNFYPEIKPFTPDYKFLSAALDAREAKYNAGWKATNDLYSRVYSDLSRSDNK